MSTLEVHVEGDRIIVQIQSVRMELSSSVATTLVAFLQAHIPLAEQHEQETRSHHLTLVNLDAALRQSVTGTLEPASLVLEDCLSELDEETALLRLQERFGAVQAFEVLVHCLLMDERGSYHVTAQFDRLAMMLLKLVARAPEETVIARLWAAGSFDNALFQHCVVEEERLGERLNHRLTFLSLAMASVPSCTFAMGDDSSDSWDFEQPIHEVFLSRSFLTSRYPVTQQLYSSVMGSNPSEVKGALLPVTGISWWAAIQFCNRLSLRDGLVPCYVVEEEHVLWDRSSDGYRLLTEAEWECAARGTTRQSFSGNELSDDVAWTKENSDGRPRSVGSKAPNDFGLYDMSGNVWEWVWDWYDGSYYSSSPTTDPSGPEQGRERVCRGGSYFASAHNARVSIRGRFSPDTGWRGLGFRIGRWTPDDS